MRPDNHSEVIRLQRDRPRIEPLDWRRNRLRDLLRLRPLTRLIRTTGYMVRERRFLATPAPVADANGQEMRWHDGLVATVAFNRPDLTRWQVRLVGKFLAERSAFVVYDNSPDPAKRAEIRAICADAGVPYIALPANRFRNSRSHGAAMNWIFANHVRRDRPAFFGFLDHDIFPIEPVSLVDKLGRHSIYGLRRSDTPTPDGWFLWAGYCFFAAKYARQNLDFMPTERYTMDTGGGNWPLIFRDIAAKDVRFAELDWHRVGDGDNMYDDFFQLLDGWLHVSNASHWRDPHSDRSRELLNLLRAAAGPDAPDTPLERI